MSVYSRVVLRFVILCALILGAITLWKPMPAEAFSCVGDCSSARQACLGDCVPAGSESCQTTCNTSYQDCLACCFNPGTC
jgi:hypothetical protein